MAINFTEKANFIWSIAEQLRGDYKQSEYGRVVLPFTVLRRLDCVLEPTKEKVLSKLHNRSKYNFNKLIADPENIAVNLRHYINGFSENARETFEHFDFEAQIDRLDKADLLYLVVKRFQEIDLHPDVVSNNEMGYLFEELIRKFSEISIETAGEHFTPREVIRLMVNILFLKDRDMLTKEGITETLYDPCAGTGGMLSAAEEYLHELNPKARLEVFGQELNPESYSICTADMMIKGQNADNIKLGNSFSDDQLAGQKFSYMLTNPPFGAGLPGISDGSLMFLQHLISKMRPTNGGARIGIVFNGSPLFSGGAGSGESEIRRWIIGNDMLEAIIALPEQLFYNTGIFTYLWFVSNRKSQRRKGKVQMINAVSFFEKMSKSLGSKRNYISDENIRDITILYGDFQEGEYCKIFDNEDFGYSRITVERPLKDEKSDIINDKRGKPKSDSSLRDYENVPLKEDIKEYFEREVLPHVPDAWIDESKTRVGYEVNFTRYFYKFKPLRALDEIKTDILALEQETEDMIHQILED